jgi:ABC-2 type transport system permease protein
MRIIIKIAKNELRNLFYSPIAWFLAIIMMAMCSFYYTGMMYPIAKFADLIYRNKPNWVIYATESATEMVYMNLQSGFFANIMQHLYLFVPLLTMGIINREFNSGTIRLLYSSPVKLRNIVLGKYLAVAIYNLILVSFILFFIASGSFDIRSLDFFPLLSATLGIYLFLCALTAIGFFMSSLTTYQIVSAIASFTLLFILSRIGRLWQEYDFVRDLTNFLSIVGRTEKMVVGLIRTKDVMYYLVIIYMFVSFTLLKLKAGREMKPWYIKTGRYLVVIIIGLLIGYTTSLPRFTGYLDATARKTNTIHPRTQQIIRELNEGPLEVTIYTNLLSGNANAGLPRSRNEYLTNMWENYQRFKTDIQFKYEYYYATVKGDNSWYIRYPGKTLQQIVGIEAKLKRSDSALFKSPEEMRKIIDLEPEGYAMVMQLKYKGRTTFLRMSFMDAIWPDEQNLNAALKRLLQAHIPKVYFVTGELERNIYKKGEREFFAHTIYKRKLSALINNGFDVDTLNLSAQDIPADASIVVIADPKTNFIPIVLNKLNTYVNNGGNMLVYLEPGKQYVLDPLLQDIGIHLKSGQLVQANDNETPDKAGAYITQTGFNIAEEYWLLKYKHLWSHKVFDSLKLTLVGLASLSLPNDNSFTVQPLLLTNPGISWLKVGRLVIDSTAPVFSPQEGDIKEMSFLVAMQMSRQLNNKEQRIIISGDADFASNSRLIDDLTRAAYSWLVYNEFPIYTPIPYAKDNKIILSPARAAEQKIIYVWVLPGLIMLTGTVLLIRRKRK